MSKTTDTIAGLRFQVYPESNEVHVHDDQKSIKFIGNAKDFKKEVNEAMKSFAGSAGAVLIKGTSKEQLCLVDDGKRVYASVVNDTDVTSDLIDFLKKL